MNMSISFASLAVNGQELIPGGVNAGFTKPLLFLYNLSKSVSKVLPSIQGVFAVAFTSLGQTIRKYGTTGPYSISDIFSLSTTYIFGSYIYSDRL